jgi:hypothetical protein
MTIDVVGPPSSGLVTEDEIRECGRVSRKLPLGQSVSGEITGARSQTIMSFAFVPSATRVRVDLGSRGVRHYALRQLPLEKARLVGIRPMSYWTRAFIGMVCLREVVAYNSADGVVGDSGHRSCESRRRLG